MIKQKEVLHNGYIFFQFEELLSMKLMISFLLNFA